jgi:hypothetical protein
MVSEKSETKLYEALHAVQAELPTLQKDAINPHFGNSYITLKELMSKLLPILNGHGLVVLQLPTVVSPGVPGLRTVITHAKSGQTLSEAMPLVLGKQDPQGQGSALTYARRYSLMSILGLVADEDDDGNAGSAPKQRRTRKPADRSAEQIGGDEAHSPGSDSAGFDGGSAPI